MKRKEIMAFLVLVLYLMVYLPKVSEAVPMGTAITYQGRLMDANGPSDGVYDFLFKLYNEPNGAGYELPPGYDVNDIDVIDGYFTVELDFGSSSFNGRAKWLEILLRPGDSNDVNDFVTLSPRQEVTPTPYALQTRGIFVDNAEDVGIGTIHPAGKLHVDGGKAADDMDGNDIIIKAQEGGDRPSGGISVVGYPGGDIILLPGDGGKGPFGAPGQSGKVGIGTESPEVMLDVRGNIEVDQKIQAHDAGGLHLATDEGTTRILISDTGKVGIGTTSPESKLHIEQNAGAWGEGIRVSYGGHSWDIVSDSGGDRLFITQDETSEKGLTIIDGKVGIGTSSPTAKMEAADGSMNGKLSYHHETGFPVTTTYDSGVKGTYGSDVVGHLGYRYKLMTLDPVYYGVHGSATTTGNNVGIYGSASGGTSNWAGYFNGDVYAGGNVGVGTTNPGAKLDVRSPGASEDAISAYGTSGNEMFLVTQDNLGNGKVFVRDASGGTKIQLAAYGYSLLKGGNVGIGEVGIPQEKLVVRGNILVKSDSTGADVLELGEGLDYAEGFDVTEEADIEAGMVLVIDSDNPGKLTVSRSAYDSKVAGIVAGANGNGSGVRLGVGQFDHDVALAGRVYCKVDTTNAAVQPGDLLTTSGTAGYAMKVTDHERARGAVLGKAMESLEKGQKGQILVLVTLQ